MASIVHRLILTLLLLVLSTEPALTANSSDYSAGVEAYKTGDYKKAAQKFHSAVTGGCDSAAAWLYLGHSYNASGDRTRAAQVYRTIAVKFKGGSEEMIALATLRKIEPPAVPAKTASVNGPAAKTPQATHFVDRITLYPPKFGHQPISHETAETVKSVARGLPPHILKILDESGATITVAPNIIDKWPGSGDGLKPGVPDTTMGEEPGRTYGHDVHIYEREQIRGSTELKAVRSQSEIRHTTLHEIGHALDDSSGPLSNSSIFKNILKQDLDEMPADVATKVSYYAAAGEACAEVLKGLLGGYDDSSCALVLEHMPRVKRLLKEKFRL